MTCYRQTAAGLLTATAGRPSVRPWARPSRSCGELAARSSAEGREQPVRSFRRDPFPEGSPAMTSAEPAAVPPTAPSAEPGLLPRIVGLFAKLGLVPGRCLAQTEGSDRSIRMTVELSVAGIEDGMADHVAACMRQIYGVEQVLSWQGPAAADRKSTRLNSSP